jgi:cytochrome c peroxidase
LPEVPFTYSELDYPETWLNDPALQLFGGSEADITDAGATLGRVLFYDPQLSVDGTISCGSCHLQDHAFADASPGSIGVTGVETPRNTMPLFNLRYQRRMFWDGRTFGLINQVLEPIAHPDEMGMTLADLPAKLAALPHYPALFAAAFGNSAVTLDGVASALDQFLRSIRSHASRYDEGLATGFANFTPAEELGRSLFFNGTTRCNQCHSGLTFFSTQLFINGLDSNYAAAGDAGRGELTGIPSDDGRFRTVSLRNVGLTAPYMHDGRFATLREVVDFYSDNIQPHPFLDERLTEAGFGPAGQPPYRLELTEQEREGLVAFLETLTDTTLAGAWWLSNPF